MAIWPDLNTVSLREIQARIETSDLIPSREILREGLAEKIAALEQQGLSTLSDLRGALKTPKRLAGLAAASGVDADYLTQLRREVDSYDTKPVDLSEFEDAAAARLAGAGVSSTTALFEAAAVPAGRGQLARAAGVAAPDLEALLQLATLTRIQWVSPTFARVLYEAGYRTPSSVAGADPETLSAAIETANAGARFFKGKIGLRDMKRLIHAAGYVPDV